MAGDGDDALTIRHGNVLALSCYAEARFFAMRERRQDD
jgi:hypothetical protein